MIADNSPARVNFALPLAGLGILLLVAAYGGSIAVSLVSVSLQPDGFDGAIRPETVRRPLQALAAAFVVYRAVRAYRGGTVLPRRGWWLVWALAVSSNVAWIVIGTASFAVLTGDWSDALQEATR